MGPLLDTHALLWYALGDRRRISRSLQKQIESGPAIAGIASIWKVAIKTALGKLESPDDLPARLEALGFELLPVTADPAWEVRELPHHHPDPFDRLLIAQARVERLPLLTADPAFAAYGVEVIWNRGRRPWPGRSRWAAGQPEGAPRGTWSTLRIDAAVDLALLAVLIRERFEGEDPRQLRGS